MKKQYVQERQIEEVLVKMEIEEIDPAKTIMQQSFEDVKWTEGEPPENYFIRLHRSEINKGGS
jgi:hypothetical protein